MRLLALYAGQNADTSWMQDILQFYNKLCHDLNNYKWLQPSFWHLFISELLLFFLYQHNQKTYTPTFYTPMWPISTNEISLLMYWSGSELSQFVWGFPRSVRLLRPKWDLKKQESMYVLYLCLFNNSELSCSYDKTVQRFTFAAQNNKVIPNNVCLFPQNSFWYLTLPCQTFTSSPRCRSCGRWRPSRWWAVCHFTSSSTCEDASARPTTPSWPLKDWDEPVASFKTEGCPCLHPADPALRPENQTPDSSPLICFWKVLLGNVKRRTVMSGTECLLRGRAGVMKQRHLLHVFDAKTIWWFLSAEAELV